MVQKQKQGKDNLRDIAEWMRERYDRAAVFVRTPNPTGLHTGAVCVAPAPMQ